MSQISKLAEKLQNRVRQIANDLVADEELQASRLAQCHSCEYLFTATNQCKKCGCFVNLKSKSKQAQCPIGKW